MKEATKTWIAIAEDDFKGGSYLYEHRLYPQAIYLFCQALEKVLKAAQIEKTDLQPKKIHHLHIIAKETDLEFTVEQYEQLEQLSKHYGRVRYPDISQAFYNTKSKTESIINMAQELYLWVHKILKNQ